MNLKVRATINISMKRQLEIMLKNSKRSHEIVFMAETSFDTGKSLAFRLVILGLHKDNHILN